MQSRLTLDPPRTFGNTVELAATFIPAHQPEKPQELWWRIPAEYQHSIATNADPFVVAFLFSMMQSAKAGHPDVFIDAPVSPSLLANLETHMSIWSAWLPDLYRPANITAIHEIEPPPPPTPGQAIMPFSCGVDSSFAALRHTRNLLGRRNKNIRAAVIIHGFDIWLDQANADGIYAGLLNNARNMLNDLGIPCIPVATNFHDLPPVWAHSHGAQLAAALRLFSPQFDTAVIPNSLHCTVLSKRYLGSNPYTDPFFSSKNFQFIDDAADLTRIDRIKLLTQWPAALQNLRVCFSNGTSHTNCCRCEKCLIALLTFRVFGIDRLPAFPNPPTDRQLARTRITSYAFPVNWQNLEAAITQHNLQKTSWAKALRSARRRSRFCDRLHKLETPFIPVRNKLRNIFRGSPLSQSQIQNQKSKI